MRRADALAEVLRRGLPIPRADLVEVPEDARRGRLVIDVAGTDQRDVFRVQVAGGEALSDESGNWNAETQTLRTLAIFARVARAMLDQEIYVQSRRDTWEALKLCGIAGENLRWCGHPEQKACELVATPFDVRAFDRSKYQFPVTLAVVPAAHASIDEFLVRRPAQGGLGAVRVKAPPPRLRCDPLVWLFVDEGVAVPSTLVPFTMWQWCNSEAGWQRRYCRLETRNA